ncbi:chromate efflux transporter [Alsobacter sp. SYSU M60028]|uniref:Chromate efflux transporter n=2 Tax=Alsobacter ponti TaxID=2962936 RepID=A0ABT1LI03_9HYPH|nr:chromate efflux transporter [Alsobacter ponti]MCP8941147.1 chromate efflux transporter [Alsobacter ponti]
MEPGAPAPGADAAAPPFPSFREALAVWARVAALSFGGPAGQIAVMHRILVDEKRWISERRFLHALNYCMLLPGPEAQQLATYVGWLLHGAKGGLAAGLLFILPGVVAIMALSMIYAAFGHVSAVAALFFGLKAAVLAIVLQALARVASRALTNRLMVALAALSFVAIFFFRAPFPLIVAGAGVLGFAAARAGLAGPSAGHAAGASARPEGGYVLDDERGEGRGDPARARWVALLFAVLWAAPVAALVLALGPDDVFSRIALFFSKMAVVTFGGAYAALAYVAQQAVENYGWLAAGEMLDGLGMAETTPGPLIMVLQFVGFMAAWRDPGGLPPWVAGVAGGLIATWVTFTPCFLWIFLGAPYIEVLRGNRALAGALSAITAAVVGVILNLGLWFAIHVVFRQTRPVEGLGASFDAPVLSSVDPWALALSAAALWATFRLRLGMLTVLALCSAAGLALHLAGLVG